MPTVPRLPRRIIAALGALPLACAGVNDADVHDAPPPPPPSSCRAIADLAPAFFKRLQAGDLDGLRGVIQLSLSRSISADPDSPPPVVSVLHGAIGVLNQFAADPPEPGGSPCATSSPPAGQVNRLC